MKCGGIGEALRMIAVARAHGMKVMLGCMIESSVAITAAAHLSPLVDTADLDGNLLLEEDPFEGVRVESGRLVLPDAPGLGVKPAAPPAAERDAPGRRVRSGLEERTALSYPRRSANAYRTLDTVPAAPGSGRGQPSLLPLPRRVRRPGGGGAASLVLRVAVDRGVFSCRNARGEAVLGPGWLMFGNEGEAYVCSHENGAGDDCIVLGLSGPIHDAIQDALGQVGGAFTRPAVPPLPRVAALLKPLLSGVEGFALEETALAVVAAVQGALGGRAPAPAPRERDRAVAAARYIETHAAEPLTLAAVAREVGLSPFHFLRSFQRAIGITPHQYLVRTRLTRAITLLADTTMPVTEAAYEAGWADLSNFIRTFRRDVGCSPREFRRNGALRGRRSPGSGRLSLPAAQRAG